MCSSGHKPEHYPCVMLEEGSGPPGLQLGAVGSRWRCIMRQNCRLTYGSEC